MRKIFLDCGAHKATSVKRFKKEYPGSKEYEIYSFEGMIKCEKSFKKYPDVKFKNNLVWIEDGEQIFYNNKRERTWKKLLKRRFSFGKVQIRTVFFQRKRKKRFANWSVILKIFILMLSVDGKNAVKR